MKKKTFALISAGMLCLMTACGNSDRASSRQESTNAVDAAIQSQIQIENGKAIVDDNPNAEPAATTQEQVVKQATTEQQTTQQDVTEQPVSADNTTAPIDDSNEEFKGEPDVTDKWYHYCFISDAAACCQQGLEFTWDDGSHELDEFPTDGSEIVVTGVFEIYKDNEDDVYTYCQLADASLEVVNENVAQ